MARPALTFARSLAQRIIDDPRWVVIFMLLALHLAMVVDSGGAVSRPFLLSHFGFFLLWQPLMNPERSIKPLSLILLLGLSGVVVFVFRAWGVVIWICGLLALLGGRGFSVQAPRLRRFYLLAFVYLFVLLLFWVVPRVLAGLQVNQIVQYLVPYGLPALLVAMAIVPLEREANQEQRLIDFFYSLMSFQFMLLLAVGSLAVMRTVGGDYYVALLLTITVGSVLLFVLALLWNPMGGYPGLSTYFSRYLLSVGVPFEGWLQELARQAESVPEAGAFLDAAVPQMARLPWVVGGEWRSAESEGRFGRQSPHLVDYPFQDLRLKLHTDQRLGPPVVLHVRLLAQLLNEFYEAKRREQLLKQNAYMQAVHETGARLTHDVKNLLQSLMSLSAAGQLMAGDQSAAYAAMVQRQLPQLSKRLQLTLERLQRPNEAMTSVMQSSAEWWDGLKTRYEGRDIVFDLVTTPSDAIPRNLFDSVSENLLENAIRKRDQEPGIEIRARFTGLPDVRFSVLDSGSPVPLQISRYLFGRPVSGNAGMGIGLLQAAKQAESAGYRLRLLSNEPGGVCFELTAVDPYAAREAAVSAQSEVASQLPGA
jgi:signal transduction histidine kinase